MAAAGVPCPWFRLFSTGDDLAAVAGEVPYPCVVKPTTLNGSRGVIRADDPAGVCGAGAAAGPPARPRESGAGPHPFLVESFHPRRARWRWKGCSTGGELTVLALFDKPDPLDGPFFEETIYTTPSRLPAAVQAAIARCDGAGSGGDRAADGADPRRAARQRRGAVAAGGCRPLDRGAVRAHAALRAHGGRGAAMSLEELIVRQACGLPWRRHRAGHRCQRGHDDPHPRGGAAARGRRGPGGAGRAGDRGGGDQRGAPPHRHAAARGRVLPGLYLPRGATPAAVEESLRAAHGKLRFTIVPEIELGL